MKIITSVLRKNLFAAFFFSLQIVSAQNPIWMNFTNGDMITDLEGDGNILWVGTGGGLLKYDKTLAQETFYNKANSGLPQNYISSLATEAGGILWLTTDAGLSSFDGTSWNLYDTSNSGLTSPYILDVDVDQNGTKWIATGSGLVSFDGTSWTVYDTSNSNLSGQNVLRIFISPSGEKWLVTYYGLERFDGTNWTLYNSIDAPWLHNTTDIAFKNNDVYVATHGDFGQGAGLIKFDGTTWSTFDPLNSGLPFYGVQCLDFDTTGNLWIGNHPSFGFPTALVMYDGNNWTADSTGVPGMLMKLLIDQGNKIFTGTEGQGLFEYSGSTFSKINTSNSGLNLGGGNELCIDDVQDIWTVNTHGFAHFDRQSWNVFDSSQSNFLNSNVFCIARDHSNGTWIGTQEGVIKFDGANWTRWDTSNSQLTNQFISAIAVDPDNATWVGTNSAPFKFDGTNWIDYFANAGSNINDVFVTDDGDVWMGSPGYGLNRFDRISTWTNYTPTWGGNFQAGALDKNGNVWYGGSNLHRWDGNNWTMFGTADGLPWNFITALAVDTNNILWIGTQSGLSSFDGNVFTNYFRRNSGLTADYISDIDVDGFNNKWIGTSDGISVYNESGVVMAVGKSVEPNKGIRFYPNPASEEITVMCESYKAGMQLVITDILGNEVYSSKISSSNSKIDVSKLNSGVYTGIINNGESRLVAGKIIIR